MATGLDDLASHLKATELAEFAPTPYYEPETDSLILYFRDESSYSKRVTEYLTVFLDNSDNSLVGIEVTGVSRMLQVAAPRSG